MKPIVRVIAHTTFLGVPPDLLGIAPEKVGTPEGSDALRCQRGAIWLKEQDRGTDAERLVECAGRTCYDSYGRGRPSTDYHKHIMDVDHGSVTEHAWISFFLSGISRGLTHELVRHRVGVAISQRSTRYVDENESAWMWHPLIQAFVAQEEPKRAGNGELVELGMDRECKHVKSTADQMYKKVVAKLEEWLTTRGTDRLTARKQARGAARGLLGNALMTEMVWSCNIRALKTVLAQRAKAAADAEIRVLANMLYEAALPHWPTYLGCYEKRECPDGIGYELVIPPKPEILNEREKTLMTEIAELKSELRILKNGATG
jgi:thymidylate synthase (FAD)